MKRIYYLILATALLAGCKGSKSVSSSTKKSGLTEVQQAEVTNVFFNANKEKILGNLDNAAGLFSEVIRKDPTNAASYYELANIYSEQKRYADALYFAKTAYQLDTKNSWYALSYSDILQKNRKYVESAEVLEQLVNDFPDRTEFYYEWATALMYAEKPADAIKVYDKLEAKIGANREVGMQKSRIYQRLNKSDKAVEELKKLIELDRTDAQAYGMLAEVYQSMGQNDKALETFNKILEVDPENPYVHLSLADFYRTTGEKEKSVAELKKAFTNKELDIDTKISILGSYYSLVDLHPELLEQALEMGKLLTETHPSEPNAHAVYADFLTKDKKTAQARDEYRKARSLGSREFSVYYSILLTDAQLSDWDTLKVDGEEAMSLFPDQPGAYFFTGMAYIQLKKYSDAVSTLNSGVKMVVDNKGLESQFYASLGDAYNEMKNYPKSDENYDKALEINPKDATVLNNYAYYLSVRGEELEKAERMSRSSNELEPTSASYQDTYGWIMYKQGKYSDAKIWIEKALSNGSDSSATVLEHYGDVLFRMGDNLKALEYWQKAKAAGEGGSEFLEKKILEKKIFE